jgi:long-chain acyl-CoA synthetase
LRPVAGAAITPPHQPGFAFMDRPTATVARPWLAEYPPGVPAEIDLSTYTSMADLLAQAVQNYGPQTAFHQLGVNITFRQLDEYSARLAAYFQQSFGLQPGDRIALMLPNVIQYPIAMFAALRAGLTIVNVNPLYTAPELVSLIADSTPRAIIALETCAATLQRALKSAPVDLIIIARIAELIPFPRGLIADYVIRKKKKLVPAWSIPNARTFRNAMRAHPAAAFAPPPLSAATMAFLQYTGGTTGAPKAAVLSHGNVLADVLIFGAWWKPTLSEPGQTTLIALPLYHVAALVCQCLVGIHFGAKAVLVINPRDIPALVNDFEAHKPAVFAGLNTLFTALLNNPKFQTLDFSSLKLAAAGGTATQPAIADRWQALTGCTIIEAYGLSETAGAATANPITRETFDGTIGVPLPSIIVEIRDENGLALPPGAPGEICIKGPIVMQGYYQRPEETAKILGADGFLATGDIGIMNPEGKIKIIDRKKDMVLVSGFNVYPNEIEDVLFRHPGILEVAVVGIADAQSGEIPVACVVRKDPALQESDIIAYARENLAAYKIPRRVIFITELPKTPVGKVLRRQLRDTILP